MKGVKCYDENTDINIEEDLKETLSGLMRYLFPNKEYRFNKDYFYEQIREICGNNIESVEVFDKYHNKKNNKYSISLHLRFCPETNLNNPSEFNKIANEMQEKLWCALLKQNILLRSK